MMPAISQTVLLLTIAVVTMAFTSDEGRVSYKHGELLQTLLSTYDRRVISRENGSPLLVNVGFTLIQLHSLDEKNQMLTSSGWFQMRWIDSRLSWDPESYDNRTSVVVPSRELWLPDIGFLNSASIYHSSMIKNEFRCVVYSNGEVLWVPGGTYYTTCELNISKFPFDKQRCEYHLTNWAYNIQEMNLTMSSDTITMESYRPSAEWAVSRTAGRREQVVYECCGNVSYPSLYFTVWIERKSLYYVVNIILPCIILSLVATFTFCVPPDSGEKISLGITLLLSFTVFQLIVAESIPRRSDSVPIISLYISVITIVVTASIISTIFISQLHHRGAVPLPRLLRVITFNFLARLVCLNSLRKVHSTSSYSRRPKISTPTATASCKLKLMAGRQHALSNSCGDGSLLGDEWDTSDHKHLVSIDNKLELIIECLAEYEYRRNEENSAQFMREEWHAAGKVFDRFFFAIYILLMGIITVNFLFPTKPGDT